MERTFWTDALLVVVTLGLYMPYWFYERNKRLRETHPELGLAENTWWLVGGLVLTFFGAWLAFMDPFYSAAMQMLAVVVFSIGVYVLAKNGEAAADVEGIEWSVPAPFVAGLFGAAFLAVQAGNIFSGLIARGFAIVLLATLPFLFYRIWEELDLLIPDVSEKQEASRE